MKFTAVATLAYVLLSTSGANAAPSSVDRRHHRGHHSSAVVIASSSVTAAALLDCPAQATVTVFATAAGGEGALAESKASTTTAQATASAKAVSNSSGSSKGGSKGTNGGNGGKVVTVTQTIKHVQPVTKTVTSTKNNGGVVTTTVEDTIVSTEIRTVTAAPTPTTVILTTTHDQPVTVTATVTEGGQELVKTTAVLTETVTVTSSVVQQTLLSTTTQSGSVATDSVAAATDASSTTTSGAATATSTSSTGDLQTSLTLDSKSIMTALLSDGNPTAGQAASLTSPNNFINFCETQNVPITDGLQVKTGSCNPVPMGRILSTDKLPSSVFVFPPNFGTIPANKNFTIQMKIGNLATGNFVNAEKNYYAAPAQVDGTGTLVGHSHVTVELIDSLTQPTPTDPTKFAFFKGLNGVAVNGILTAEVAGGLPQGIYRMGSINAAANHQPALASVAQHGTMDSITYFTVA